MGNIRKDETLLEMLKRHEGYSRIPYKCTADKISIGYGRNLSDVGISESEALILLTHDMQEAMLHINQIFPDFTMFSKERQKALTNMVFNLGKSGFLGFRKMIDAILDNDWDLAAIEAENSKWFRQVKGRGIEIVEMLKNG